MADERTSGVYPLRELDDLKVSDRDTDPRGWTVYAQDGHLLGEVKDLLVDTAAMQVRYLEVELDRDAAGAEGAGRRVLFPVGTARLDERDDRVFVDVSGASAAGLPAYAGGGPVTRDYENSVRRGFVTAAGTTAGTAAEEGEITAAELDYYSHDHYDTARFYGARGGAGRDERAAGSATDDAAPAGAADDDEIRVRVYAEQLVVSKRPVVREELVIRKRLVQTDHVVEADLRRERVEVRRTGERPADGTDDRR